MSSIRKNPRDGSDSRELDFSDTKIAFAALSDTELHRAYLNFKVMSSNTLVAVGPKLINAALAVHLPIGWAIKPTVFRQFCGGTSIEDCEDRVARLKKFGIGTILDYAVEGETSSAGFEATKDEILRTIMRAKGAPEIAFCVFKMTGLAHFALLEKVTTFLRSRGPDGFFSALDEREQSEWRAVESRVETLCASAEVVGTRIFIDAEETWIQDAIDYLAERAMRLHNRGRAVVYTTIQLYRVDRLTYFQELVLQAKSEGYFLGAKLVRGAYMNKERARAAKHGYECPIQKSKADTDIAYDAALRFAVANINHVAICAGTHSETSSAFLAHLTSKAGLAHQDPRVYFSQLLGMGEHLTFNLAFHGFCVAKYVPYGPVEAVLPYLFRRAEENTSIAGQTGRELAMIESEIKRRRG